MKTNQSPGNWAAQKGAEGEPDRWIIVADNGTQPYHIATVENGQPGDCLDTDEATAKLIADAPPMINVLMLIEYAMARPDEDARDVLSLMSPIRQEIRRLVSRHVVDGQNVIVHPPAASQRTPLHGKGGDK